MGYRMKYTGEEVENRLEKVEANEESIAAIDGRVTEAEGKITEAEGKIAENESKIAENADKIAEVGDKADANASKIAEVDEATKTNAEDIASLGGKVAEVEGKADANATAIEEVGGKADANAGKIAEVEGKADANTESITEIGGKVTEIEGSITEINGSIDTLLEGVAAVDAKANSNEQNLQQLGAKFYVTEFSMTEVRAAAATATLPFRATKFYSAIIGGRLVYIRDYNSSGAAGTGACVPQTYEKSGIATAVIYDTVDRKWYTLSAAQSDRYITVTASDSVNLMANEIYTTEFTMQQLIAALGESDSAKLGVSTEGFVAALTARKSIFIPDGTGGGYISLSGSYSSKAVFYVADSKMFLTITAANADALNLRRRFFDATYYVDIASACQLPGEDGQTGGVPGEALGVTKVFYRKTKCPTFIIGNMYPLRVGEVINLRFIFTEGLGDVSVNTKVFVACRNKINTSSDMAPAIVDVTAINPGADEKIVLFYTIKKYNK